MSAAARYFRNPAPYVVGLIMPTFVLGALGFGSIATGDVSKVVIGVVCLLLLVVLLGWVLSHLSKPAVTIAGDSVEIRGRFGRLYRIEDVRAYQLVVSTTWIGFRKGDAQDLMIDRNWFSKGTWSKLEQQLLLLPCPKAD